MASQDFWQTPKELSSIASEEPMIKTLEFNDDDDDIEKVVVSTDHGPMSVFIQGDTGNKPIITVHEIGLNYKSCFRGLLSHASAEPLKKKFCFYHISLPGQGPREENISKFPSLDNIAGMVGSVAKHFKFPGFVGIGAGAGANILLRYCANNPPILCRGLLLISPLMQTQGWLEWGFDKIARTQLSMAKENMPAFVVEQYLKTYFGTKTMAYNHDLVQIFRKSLATDLNPANFRLFQAAYSQRSDLMKVIKPDTFRTPVLMMYGGQSIHSQQIEQYLDRFAADRFSHIKIWECGDMLQEEEPDEVNRAFKLFLQGLRLLF